MWRTGIVDAVAPERRPELHVAPWIGSYDGGGPAIDNVADLAVAKIVRHLLADDVVDSGASAAE